MSVTAPQLLSKQPSEKRKYSMSFANLMDSDETISSITSVTSEKRGEGSSDLVITNTAINGQTIEMWIEGGTNRKTYRIEVKISTSGGQELEGDGMLKVKEK